MPPPVNFLPSSQRSMNKLQKWTHLLSLPQDPASPLQRLELTGVSDSYVWWIQETVHPTNFTHFKIKKKTDARPGP